MTKLGDFTIKCYLPMSQKVKLGIIGPIGLETDPEEIKEELIENGYPIMKVERLEIGPKDSKRKTKTMKIWFETNLLPEHVEFMWEIFKVTPFADHPWQCFKCQKFGHNAKFCTSNQKCVICSEDHSYKECPNKDNVKCSNYGKNHAASYGSCVAMKKEMEIQKVRTKENLSYRDAAIKISKPQK